MSKEEIPRIRALIHDFDQLYKSSVEDYADQINSERSRLLQELKEIADTHQNAFTEGIESFSEAVKAEEKQIIDRLSKMLVHYKQEFENNTENSLEGISEFLEGEKNKFHEDIQALLRKFQTETKEISYLKIDIENKQASFIDYLKEQRRFLENELKTISHEQLELFEKEGSQRIEKLHETIQEKIVSSRDEISEFQENFIKDIRKQQQKQENEMSRIQTDLNQAEDELTHLKDSLKEFKAESSIVEVMENKSFFAKRDVFSFRPESGASESKTSSLR